MALSVSIILPTFNRADLIGETLDSILAQSRPVDEILVVNDGSTDATMAVLEAYGDRIKILEKENGGKASALNLGLEVARGDLIWVADDDDLMEPDACALLAGALEADPELAFCAGRHEDFVVNPTTGEHEISAPGYWRPSTPDMIFFDLLDGCHIFQPSLMVRAAAYKAAGAFRADLIRSQDYEMILRIARRHKGRILPERVFLHREHNGARGAAADRFKAQDMNAKWARYNAMIFEPLLADLAPEELLPAEIWTMPERAETRLRTAELKRASVYARQQMWTEAIALWETLAADTTTPLDPYERNLVKQATLAPLGCDPLLDDRSLRERVIALKAAGRVGRDIAGSLGNSVRWQARKALQSGQLGDIGRVARFMLPATF